MQRISLRYYGAKCPECVVTRVKAYLVLEDGTIFEGEPRAAFRETVFEAVFNTSMTGYLEILSDPSYAGQGIVMTYPLIGNYGVQPADRESGRLNVSAFLIRELCDIPSNFRCEKTLEQMLVENDIPCLVGIDTRAVVRLLRENGTMTAMLTEDASDWERCREKMRHYSNKGMVESVSLKEKTVFGAGNTGPKIAMMDYGAKSNIIRSLVARGCEVTAYPCETAAAEVLAAKPDGIMLSNGPGDPKNCPGMIREVGELYRSGVPMFAICLGHQLIALSQGADTGRLKYGHRGGNHPVKDLACDRTYITSQNHGYVVTADSLPKTAEVSHINVNDGTVEGITYLDKPVFSVQYHPEAAPGPQDSAYLFDHFMKMIGGNSHA